MLQESRQGRSEMVSHPVILWAESVSAGLNDTRLRRDVVDKYSDLPVVMQQGGFWDHREYAKTHDWADIEPDLTRIALGLTSTTTLVQREVVGLGDLVHSAMRGVTEASGSGAFYPLGIILYNLEYKGRLDWAEDFQDSEDWLTTLGHIIRIGNRQIEAEATARNSICVAEIQNGVRVEDIERVYADVVRTIRPSAQAITTFRACKNDFDGSLQQLIFLNGLGNQDLASYIANRSAADRRRSVGRFLSRYNDYLDQTPGLEKEALAWIYGTYTSIHPHPDYNGTMTRVLINGYLLKKGFATIDWLGIKQEEKADNELERGRGEFTRGRTSYLKQWFGDRVEGLSSK